MSEQSDLDLLTLAAKAAGLEFSYSYDKDRGFLYFPPKPADWPSIFPPSGRFWNPLTDDGDAQRLAVAVRIGHDCYVDSDLTEHCCAWVNHRSVSSFHRSYEAYGTDANAATRRAIVRTAAAVGAALPKVNVPRVRGKHDGENHD